MSSRIEVFNNQVDSELLFVIFFKLQVCVSERQKQNNKNTVDQEKERYLII
jgi:hypothetical protein